MMWRLSSGALLGGNCRGAAELAVTCYCRSFLRRVTARLDFKGVRIEMGLDLESGLFEIGRAHV